MPTYASQLTPFKRDAFPIASRMNCAIPLVGADASIRGPIIYLSKEQNSVFKTN